MTDPAERRDELSALVDRARAGSPAAWRAVWDELAPAVAGYLRVQGAAEVDDLTSDVFLGVVRGIAGFRGDWAAFRSWVFVIAHHRLIDDRRRRARAARMTADASEIDVAHDDDPGRRLGTDAVVARCAQLAPDQRDVLLLRIVADMTIDQIADALGRSPGAVKALQRRGLGRLQEILTSEGVPL